MDAPSEVVALSCWKDIATYLGKGVRTVQRWEQEFGLPIRRPNGISHKSPVVADPRDLDAWLKSRWSVRASKTEENGPSRNLDGPTTRTQVLQEMRVNIQMASDLQARLRVVRQQHQNLVHEVGAAIAALSRTCELLSSSQKHTSDS
ncbi:MAG TPA: hypothetical protein VF126_08630 [Acidobacteriaceae bacterium]